MIDLRHGDCLEVMKDIPNESIDLIVTDCPYHIVSGGCTTGAYGNKKGCGKCSVKWETQGQLYNFENIKSGKLFDNNDIEFKQWLPELFRILKKDTHCYIMINARNLKELQQEAENAGFKFQNILVWRKNNATPNRYYLNNCEFILMLRKGKARNINNMGTKNVLDVPNIIGKKKHPTEKPVELMKILIENSSNKNDVVIDPFMGVGTTGVACKALNRNFIGIELDENYFNIAKERLTNIREVQK
jgi:site-specific DNA-methyltransferase (adenine-specific)